jgi:hypothetical protein
MRIREIPKKSITILTSELTGGIRTTWYLWKNKEGTMAEAAIGDMDEWKPFCGELYPPEQTAGPPMICTKDPHDTVSEKHVNQETGFSWWGESSP